MKYKTTIVQTGNNTGIHVPEPVLEKLGGGKKPLVKVTLNGYSYRGAVGKMGEKYLVSLSAENRNNANVKGGDVLEVTLELDNEPRVIELPVEWQKALDKNKTAKTSFEKLPPSRKKAMVLSITGAKTEATRKSRIEKAIAELVKGN
ncbi:MAG TPA: YdeI/OmpD-associated family protein [Puia sp.]|nr:YdeI/OmpD-associated family protein [Puia sp.]